MAWHGVWGSCFCFGVFGMSCVGAVGRLLCGVLIVSSMRLAFNSVASRLHLGRNFEDCFGLHKDEYSYVDMHSIVQITKCRYVNTTIGSTVYPVL